MAENFFMLSSILNEYLDDWSCWTISTEIGSLGSRSLKIKNLWMSG